MNSSFTAEEYFQRGEQALLAERHAEALSHFQAARRLEPASPRYRSYYGLAVGVVERRLEKALELCRSAAKEEFFNPAHYHNLARLHLAFGFKSEAIRYLRRGLMIDPGDAAISAEMRRLGVRQRPLLSFLRRGNPLNRWIGRIFRRVQIAPEPELAQFSV